MMRQRELLEFRTPQHPRFGTNSWGGASPLLARNIPNEALDQSYLRLNAKRDHDQVFVSTTTIEEIFGSPSIIRDEIFRFSEGVGSTPSRKGRIMWILMWQPRKRVALLGSKKSSSRWIPKLKKRWPNGWFCFLVSLAYVYNIFLPV